MKICPYYTFFLLFLSLTSINNGFANDSLTELMQGMKSDKAVKISYKETRILELMDQPWLGSGFMYSMQPDLMIKEQLQPNRLLMGVKGDKLFYFDAEKNIQHQSEMDGTDSISLNIAVFKVLMNSDEALLNDLYHIEFSSHPQRWVMTLKPKNNPQSGLNIVVSGLSGKRLDTIVVNQEDGDVSEFTLQKASSQKNINITIDQLYQELQGN